MTTETKHEPEYKVWDCKIGVRTPLHLPDGADNPMRKAVAEAFKNITGMESEFIFSGWGGELTEPELAVVENRLPSEEHYQQWNSARTSDARIAELEAALKNVLKCFSAEGYHLAPVQGGNDNQFQDVKSARAALGEHHD